MGWPCYRSGNGSPRDKTNKMACAPSEDSDQPGHPPSLIRVFAACMKKDWILSYPLSAQRRLRSDWADAQADLSLRWAHSHFVGFVIRRLKCRRKSQTSRPSIFKGRLDNTILETKILGSYQIISNRLTDNMSRIVTKPTKWHVRPASAQSDQSLRYALNG